MPEIAIQLNPKLLSNPDLDIRYLLPELIEEKSNGLITDDGYLYGRSSDLLTVYLQTTDLNAALPFSME